MIFGIRQLIHQERRRLVFVASLAFLAGFLFYARLSVEMGAPVVALVTGFVYALVIAVVTLIVCAVAPGFRFMIDAIAVSRLLLAVICFAIPEIGTIIINNPLLTALIVVSSGGLLSRAMHGQILRDPEMPWRDRFGPRAALRRRPLRIIGSLRQQKFAGWIDGAVTVAVRA